MARLGSTRQTPTCLGANGDIDLAITCIVQDLMYDRQAVIRGGREPSWGGSPYSERGEGLFTALYYLLDVGRDWIKSELDSLWLYLETTNPGTPVEDLGWEAIRLAKKDWMESLTVEGKPCAYCKLSTEWPDRAVVDPKFGGLRLCSACRDYLENNPQMVADLLAEPDKEGV